MDEYRFFCLTVHDNTKKQIFYVNKKHQILSRDYQLEKLDISCAKTAIVYFQRNVGFFFKMLYSLFYMHLWFL